MKEREREREGVRFEEGAERKDEREGKVLSSVDRSEKCSGMLFDDALSYCEDAARF